MPDDEDSFYDREVPITPQNANRSPLFQGVARLFDFGRVFTPRARVRVYLGPDAGKGVARDWDRIGRDLEAAIKRASSETGVSPGEAVVRADGGAIATDG